MVLPLLALSAKLLLLSQTLAVLLHHLSCKLSAS